VVEVPYTDEWRVRANGESSTRARKLTGVVLQETHAYLHAFLRSGERSPRAMEVATAAIEQNAADYSAWALRWACAQAAVALAATDKRSGPLLDELRYTEELAESMPKNYQLWNHRRLACAMLAHLVEAPVRATLSQREDAFTAAVLEDDAKNYHAWAHRVWMIDFFKMHAHELAFTAAHIELDDRNNSAWNARFTALHRLHGAESTPAGVAWPDEVVASEMRLVRSCIERDAANESAWAYAKAVALAARTQDALNGASLVQRRAVPRLLQATNTTLACRHCWCHVGETSRMQPCGLRACGCCRSEGCRRRRHGRC
jgi:protein farnesyltransferase/geranylgeranyltransferase type-1 subunit alpha